MIWFSLIADAHFCTDCDKWLDGRNALTTAFFTPRCRKPSQIHPTPHSDRDCTVAKIGGPKCMCRLNQKDCGCILDKSTPTITIKCCENFEVCMECYQKIKSKLSAYLTEDGPTECSLNVHLLLTECKHERETEETD